MNRKIARSTARFLSVGLTLALLILVGGLASAHSAGPGQVPADLSSSEWQRIVVQVAKLTAADGAYIDYFGHSVSISGDTAVVGAWQAIVGGNVYQGAAYIFYRNQGGPDVWGQVAKLTAADGASGDIFGYSVSVNGDTAVVGAPHAHVGANVYQGAAYVFYRDQGGPGAWGQVAKLVSADGAAQDKFGSSVSVDGDTAVVGAQGATVGPNPDTGAAYIFCRDEGGTDAWGQVARFVAADEVSRMYFGHSVSFSEDTVVVGAQGAAYVFYRDHGGPNAWGQVTQLVAVDGVVGDEFGYSVSVNGDTVVVGAHHADIAGASDQGAAYIFYRDESGPDAWGQVAKLTTTDGVAYDHFGWSVAIDGDITLVGAHWVDVGSNGEQGAAYIFYRDEDGPGAWGQVAKLTADDGAYADCFGDSVSVDGDTAVVGAMEANVGGNADQGAAYIFAPFEPVTRVYLPVMLRCAP